VIEIIRLIRLALEIGRDIWREHKSNEHEKEMEEISGDVRDYLRDNYRVRDEPTEVPDPDTEV